MVGGEVEHARDDTSGTTTGTISGSNPFPPGTHVGAKFKVEFDAKPTDQTKASFDANYSTALRDYYVEMKLGYAAFGPEIYLGPKLVFVGDQAYDQYRVGGFVSGFKVGKAELGFSGGYLRDRNQGSGFFAGVDFYVQH